MVRSARALLLLSGLCCVAGCQSPSSASSTLNVDNFVDAVITPNPASAVQSTDGRTYRVVRGNNQPDDVLPYRYVTTFTVTITLNSNATSSGVNLSFPVTVLSASGKVEQASGGIVTPPTGGDVEHYDSVILASSASTVAGVGGGVTMNFEVWYSLPSGKREALVTETISMKDNNGTTFAKAVPVRVAP
jgi:hypothetical protein